MPFCPEKGQKGAKVGRAVGKNQLFCILFKIGSLDFFHILHKVRGHYWLTFCANPISGKTLVLEIYGKKGPKRTKIGQI